MCWLINKSLIKYNVIQVAKVLLPSSYVDTNDKYMIKLATMHSCLHCGYLLLEFLILLSKPAYICTCIM